MRIRRQLHFDLASRGLACFCWAVLIVLASNVAAAAPPVVNYFYPAGVQRGQSTTITAGGNFASWPVSVWADRDGLKVECGEEKGKLQIDASAAKPGVHYLRAYDDEGASVLRPFLVGVLSEAVEAEPNDGPAQAQRVAEPIVIHGRLEKRGDVDGYAVDLKQGQTLVASLTAHNTLGSPMDAVLQVCTLEGFVLAQNDDERGFDPLIAFDVPRDGTFLVRTFAFPAQPNSTIGFAGGENYVYRLTITTGPLVDHVLPLALPRQASANVRLAGWNMATADRLLQAAVDAGPHEQLGRVHFDAPPGFAELPLAEGNVVSAEELNGPEQPQVVELPATIGGCIEDRGDEDMFRFTAAKGQQLRIRAEATALGFALDPLVTLADANGTTLKEVDDTGRDSDVDFTHRMPADGEFILTIRDAHRTGGLRHAYRLTIAGPRPDFSLALAAGEFTLTGDKPLEIPVTVNRQNGFADEIEIAVEGLPEDVRAPPAASLPKGDTAKTVKLRLTAAKNTQWSGGIRIVGKRADSAEANQLRRMAEFPLSEALGKHAAAWLTVR